MGAKFDAEQEAATQCREAENRVTKATEEILELRRAQEQERKVFKGQCERRYRDATHRCKQMVQEAKKELSKSEVSADTAEEGQRRAEENVAYLERKIQDLEAQLERRRQDGSSHIAELEHRMDVRLDLVCTQADNRVRSMAEHALDVCDAAHNAVNITTDELEDQLARASVRSEGRVRFKELCDLAKAVNNYDIPKSSYYKLKDELIALWHTQSKGSGAPIVPASNPAPSEPIMSFADSLRTARALKSPSALPVTKSPLSGAGKASLMSGHDAMSRSCKPWLERCFEFRVST